jgi:hypothetical protein
MYLLQSLIVFAVVASNIHWPWTEEPLPAVLGVLLAWPVTLAIVTVRDRFSRLSFSPRCVA